MSSSDRRWLDVIPDTPRWVEVRSILLSGRGVTLGEPDAGFVIDQRAYLAGTIGRPGSHLVENLRALLPEGDLLVTPENVDHLTTVLPDATPMRAILHLRPGPSHGVVDRTIEVAEVGETLLESLPPTFADDLEDAWVAAVSRVDGRVVSVCGAYWITETLWDVGIDTLPGYQRQGHATRCFYALDAHMGGLGLSPVWGAYEDNTASLGMAASLGFEPMDELWVFELGSTLAG
ncbi:MAG TPA: GNAT family N-acetyltransferase [Acidimicrobiia bacterium]|jgi:RimJ/RimL family protein N-acetyltransferase|nr:GNAT family N-acetyltransferase [Acidimicrobiia bacterium]